MLVVFYVFWVTFDFMFAVCGLEGLLCCCSQECLLLLLRMIVSIANICGFCGVRGKDCFAADKSLHLFCLPSWQLNDCRQRCGCVMDLLGVWRSVVWAPACSFVCELFAFVIWV